MLHYCKKCGRVVLDSKKCSYCDSQTYPVPEKYWLDGLDFLISNESKTLLREELVKTAPEFDEYLFSHRDHDLAERTAKIYAALEHGKAVLEGKDKGNPYGVTCPYCKATNVRKITITNKAVHTAIFGLWSVGRNSKNYHCDHCGSDF